MLKACVCGQQVPWRSLNARTSASLSCRLGNVRLSKFGVRKTGQALSSCCATPRTDNKCSNQEQGPFERCCERQNVEEDVQDGVLAQTLVLGMMLGLVSYLSTPDGASAATHALASGHGPESINSVPVFELAEGEDFWANMANYGRFFISVLTGTAYVAVKPIGKLLKNPVSAVFVIGGAVLVYVGLRATIETMLGLSEFEYTPSSAVTGIP